MMKKRIVLVLVLVLCAALLCACGQKEQTKYQVIGTANPGVQVTQNLNMGGSTGPVQEPNFDDGSYDPTTEESEDDEEYIPEPTAVPTTPAPTMRSEYAGATPVMIDPIDKPTPSPVPPLNFTHQVYDATNVHLSFEAPAGWMISEPSADTFMLTNPSQSADYAAFVSISAVNVSSNYSVNDLKTVVKNYMEQVGEAGFDSFSPTNTAERTLLDSKGVYANYTGVLAGNVEVAGRVHVVCVNKVLYTLHVSYPKAYTNTYKEQVYDHLRDTIMVQK